MKPALAVDEAARLIQPRDTVLCGFAAGQPVGLLDALGARADLEEVVLYTGLMIRPYALLQNPGVRVVSGFFGPIERAARSLGAPVEYLPADFHGLERLALRMKPRVVLAVTTPPDADGWLSFGVTAGASYRPFLEAARDPSRLALAEVNPRMPRIAGIEALGGNRVHISEVDAWVEHEDELIALPVAVPSPEDATIARRVAELVEDGATLQFGIGAIPDETARLLATGAPGGFGIHTEMISDGVMALHRAGKVSNRKGLYDGVTVGTFALGTQALYAWLADNPLVRILPVSAVNDPVLHRQLRAFVSVNGALAVDLAGQVAADRIGDRQYSGVGGHESFVIGASEAAGGKSVVCLKSTAVVGGQQVSRIVPRLAAGSTVTTARHHVQLVVTEHGVTDLSVLGDRSRAQALIELAHPDHREELRAAIA
ncbi:MAG TPA: acetyl-CoA hydrolase/transferase C-terminal domain-containing protein [Candidatus Binatus sp.]|nr:acetyl-CoA hydrolase/transferase C-terminal domain-containing protein [Candidatus Binatus sp.]